MDETGGRWGARKYRTLDGGRMTERVDLYGAYADFGHRVLAAIRGDTFGDDIGQNSWTSTDEYERFIAWLEIAPGHHVLEVASGSGGPALHLVGRTGCRLTGMDRDAGAVTTATRLVSGLGASDRLRFLAADANAGLPFAAGTFDALLCVDAVNHLPDRAGVLGEWRRVLRPGGRAVFTDPVVVTGPVTNEELAIRSSIGRFLFVPPGVNERLIAEAGLRLVHQED